MSIDTWAGVNGGYFNTEGLQSKIHGSYADELNSYALMNDK